MTERQKQLAIVAAVVVVALLLLLRPKAAAADTVIQQSAPFGLGDVTLPGFNMPPRASYNIPSIGIGSGDSPVIGSACCATCDSSGPSYYTPAPAISTPYAPAVVAKLPAPVIGPRTFEAGGAPGNGGGVPWWDMVGVTGK